MVKSKSHSRNIWNNISNISMHFSNIIQEGELDEKEVSISSKNLLKDHPNFIKKSLKKSNNRGRPQNNSSSA